MANKRISVFTKTGLTGAGTYYRFYQYLCKLDITVIYRRMLPERLYNRYMPISKKPLYIKVSIMVYILIRVFSQLVKDSIHRPDVLIVSRRFVNRLFPVTYKFLFNRMKRKGTKIVWDFDDEIVETKELTRRNFNYMSRLADVITVAGQANKDMVLKKYQDKVIILPTTDGDMYQLFTSDVDKERIISMDKEVRIVWAGTSVSLPFVKGICQHLEVAAEKLKLQDKRLIVTIVCNEDLEYNPHSFILRNIRWRRDIAIREMLAAHVGIMPLEINRATKAKGGFKLIQYLSIGLPVVGTGIGINNEIIDSSVGFTVDSLDSKEWGTSILSIVESKEKWSSYSHSAYNKWMTTYSYKKNLKRWSEIIGTTECHNLPIGGGGNFLISFCLAIDYEQDETMV